MVVGIEFFSTIKICENTAIYTGGANYAKQVLNELCSSSRLFNVDIIALLPSGFCPSEEDKDIFKQSNLKLRYATELKTCKLDDVNILFFPQVNGRTLRVIPSIKRKYSSLKIYATLHDRQRNVAKYDSVDRYYEHGIKKSFAYGFLLFWAKKVYFDLHYSKWVSSIDKLFTVSNCSVQKLQNKKIKYLKCFYQSVPYKNETSCTSENYALFVSGNRPEKNLLRTICAFEKLKKDNPNNSLVLKITGITKKRIDELAQSYRMKLTYSERYIMALGYVSNVELSTLYDRCKYVIFTSKAEGFGLPVVEAVLHEKLALVSYQTSIPEVVGALGRYVNAYDIDSIYEGFLDMEDESYRAMYQKYVKEKKKIVLEQMKVEKELFINEFLDR